MRFDDNLLNFIERRKQSPIDDEWYLSKFMSENVYIMTSEEAFKAIGITVEILLHQLEDTISDDLLEIIIALIRHGNTTELPPSLFENSELLINHFSNKSDYSKNRLKEIFRHYRSAIILPENWIEDEN